MIVDSYTVYDGKGNYYVVSDSMFEGCSFVIYMHSVSNFGMLRLFQENRHRFKDRILYCNQTERNVFSNNSVEVADGLFEYTGRL